MYLLSFLFFFFLTLSHVLSLSGCPHPTPSPNSTCLSRLGTHANEFEICKSTTCFLFLQEPPFVTLPSSFTDNPTRELQTPFLCHDYEQEHVGLFGIAFSIHARSGLRNTHCAWAGPAKNCSFNDLVAFTEQEAKQGYKFAVTGLLLETPQRQCGHRASASLVDNSMIIIGSRMQSNRGIKGSVDALLQLTRPFHMGTWVVLGGFVLGFGMVCGLVVARFDILKEKGSYLGGAASAFFVFVGAGEQAILNDGVIPGHGVLKWARKFSVVMGLYRMGLVAFLGIFVLFYEVAVVNFLFQRQNVSWQKSVSNLTVGELKDFGVLRDSALEDVWNAIVGREINNDVPWTQCETATDCIKQADNEEEDIQFVVTFEVVGKYLLNTESNCKNLTIFETKNSLYQFNAGWLFNEMVDVEFQQRINREITALRINDTMRNLIDDAIGDYSCDNQMPIDIVPMIILIPCLIFVIPPLLGSILTLIMWKRRGGWENRGGPSLGNVVLANKNRQGEGEEEERERNGNNV